MLLHCRALPLYPRRTNGPALVAIANANALQLPLPPKPSWPESPVFWVLRQAVGHLRQPWDPRDRARQEPPVGARCPVTPVAGMISGYEYDYDYVCMYLCMCSGQRPAPSRYGLQGEEWGEVGSQRAKGIAGEEDDGVEIGERANGGRPK